ncbi:MAG TPA: helix-turn-helix domain-containing protein [Alphaproteobacteria bacterium]
MAIIAIPVWHGDGKLIEFRQPEFARRGDRAGNMAKTSTIRGLQRGLQVFKALHGAPALTLHEVHRTTGLSKPSLLRILATLEQAGMVYRRIDDGRYRASAKLTGILRKPHRFDYVAEVAAPVLDRLCHKIVWPSDLGVPAGDHLEIVETSRALSPFVFNSARVGNRVNWLMTALGRAYLAFCPDEERRRIVTRLRNSRNPQDRLARDPKRLDAVLRETRARGYGLRDPYFLGGFYEGMFDDHLAGMAVPLLQGGKVHGCINIIWARRALTVDQMAAQHLRDLQDAAREIVSALK